MYRFEDTTIRKCDYHPFIPTSAMNYDSLFLEEYIQGYQTLSVDGREMISLDISSDNLLVGSLISSQRLPARTITVKYLLENRDPVQLLVEYRNLINFLYKKENVSIWFNDELDVFYTGRFSASDEVAGDTTSIVSTFQIMCEDPRKYTVKTFTTNGYIGAETPIDTFPIKIEVKISNSNQLKITNNKETITMLPNSLKSGDVVIFDFIENEVIVNGMTKNSAMDISSDFENFQIRQGETVTCSNGAMTIQYKGVTL